jgi:hypothetical protein
MERRTFSTRDISLRSAGDGTKRISGYAATFNTWATLPGFMERLLPGCFDRALRECDPVCLFNHNADMVLGRYKAGTLRLRTDKKGLWFECDLPKTQAANDLHESIKRGDVNACSFAFTIPQGGDKWSKTADQTVRDVNDVKLYDVSPVTYPAYQGTSVDARGMEIPAEVRSMVERLSRRPKSTMWLSPELRRRFAISSLENEIKRDDLALEDALADEDAVRRRKRMLLDA